MNEKKFIIINDEDNEVGAEESLEDANLFAKLYTERFNVDTIVFGKEGEIINRYFLDIKFKETSYLCINSDRSIEGCNFSQGDYFNIESTHFERVTLSKKITPLEDGDLTEKVGYKGTFLLEVFFRNFRKDNGRTDMSAKDRKEKWEKKTAYHARKLYAKFNPGESAYLMEDNKITKRKVIELIVRIDCEHGYTLDNGEFYADHTLLFQTRQALIQSLTEEYVARTKDKS